MGLHLKVVLKSARFPFLLLTLVAITLAISSVSYQYQLVNSYQAGPDLTMLPWIYAGAVFAHLSVNLFNEYWDFKSGLDLHTQRTPFSGGSGALPGKPEALDSVLIAALVCFGITALSGIVILHHVFSMTDQFNIELLLVGLGGLVLILFYTGPVQRFPLLCWAAPGLGFGVFMFAGTEAVLTSEIKLHGLPAALIVFILSSNLLLLNQLPDIQADAQIGRRHLWIVKGEPVALRLYLLSSCLIPMLLLSGIAIAHWPLSVLLALLPWSLTLLAWRGAQRYRQKIAVHHRYLAMNVFASLLVPLFMSVALWLA